MNHKNWILLSLLSLTISCSKMVKEEPYLSASTSKALSTGNQKSMPNTNNSLAIPSVEQVHNGIPNDKPPEMAFAKKRSKDENVVINEVNGRPTMELYGDITPWDLMIADLGRNWQLQSEDPENCQVSLLYIDPIAKEDAETGMLKKIFSSKSKHTDESGQYILNCTTEESRSLITVNRPDGSAVSSYVIDDIFAHLFVKATAE